MGITGRETVGWNTYPPYYVEWHMRKALAPMLFEDDDRAGGEARRASVVAPAQRSERAEQKARTKRTDDGSRCTASRACSAIWRPSPRTR